jgi:hypothetical protein
MDSVCELLMNVAGQLNLTPIQAGFHSRPTAAWTIDWVTTACQGRQLATVLVDEPDSIGVLLGRTMTAASEALVRMSQRG